VIEPEELLSLAKKVAERAEGNEEVEAYVSASRGTEVRAYDGDVEHLVVSGSQGIGVRVVVDGREGFAWAGSLDPDVIDATVADARDNAAFAQPDEWNGVTRPEEVEGVATPLLDLWRASMLDVGTDEKVALALELERAAVASDPRIKTVESAEYGDGIGASAIANSLGVEAMTRRTVCSLSTVVIASDGEEQQTGYGFSVGRELDDLDLLVPAADAARRATRLLGATQIPGRRIDIVLDPLVSASFLGLIASACNGERVVKGRSMFADRLGEAVGSDIVTLVDNPTNPLAYGASTHDSEGVPTRRNEMIVNGVLTKFLHNTYTGRRSGAGTTGSGVRGVSSTPGVGSRALSLAPGTATPEEILADAPRALYVQSFSGLHSGTNVVSGDFSVGATGLLIENGALAQPVREITLANTLQRMLQNVSAIGSDLTWLPGGAAGVTLRINDMTMSGA